MTFLAWVVACTWPGPDGFDGPEASEPVTVGPTPDAPDPTTSVPLDVTAEVGISLHSDMTTMPVVTWEQLVAVDESWLSWDFEGEVYTTPVVPRPVGPASEVLLGIPPETTVQVVMHGVTGGVELTRALGPVTTGRLPTDLPAPELASADPSLHRAERWLLTSVDVGPAAFFGPYYTVVLDIAGRVVWYRKTSGGRMTWQPQVSRWGGYVLIDESSSRRDAGTVTRLTLDLAQENAVVLPSWGFAFDELEDGSILFDEAENFTEFHLALMSPGGDSTRLWSCFPWMDFYTDEYWGCAVSSIRVDPIRNTILWSMFKTSTVVELDLDGDFLAEYGQYPFGYWFDPWWTNFEAQHYPVFTAEDRLLVSTRSLDGERMYAREYEVDEADRTLREIVSIETGKVAEFGGQAQRLPSGNLLWELGSTGSIQELTPDGVVVWEAGWVDHLVGHVTPVADLYALTTGW